MKTFRLLFQLWLWRMAWRDSRSSRKRLLLFVSSIVLGVAALVAISSFGVNLESAIDRQARTLLGADLVLIKRQPFGSETLQKVDPLATAYTRQTNFSSMAYLPNTEGLRLVQVRALEGDFPYYGKLETTPAEAGVSYRDGPFALVDEGLLRQFDARQGDPIKLGDFTFTIAGTLNNIPGESLAVRIVSPRVYIPLRYLEQTGLIQTGSRVGYRIFIKLPDSIKAGEVVEEWEDHLAANRIRHDTVERRQRRLGRAMANLYHFLNLVGFVALLLGSVGISSSIHLYIRQKLPTVAILRCLGFTSAETFLVYLIQAFAIGLAGALGGALLGMGIQYLIPAVVAEFLPLEVSVVVAPSAVIKGISISMGIALLFVLLPLLRVRLTSPLLALRLDFESLAPPRRDPWRLVIYSLLGIALLVFSLTHTSRWWVGLAFFLGLAATFGLLVLVAKAITVVLRKAVLSSGAYEWRQGLANLYRPHNQTLVLILALGLGTFLVTTLNLSQKTLLAQAEFSGSGSKPNLVFFDIQSEQKAEIRALLESEGAPILQDVPIVSMRLSGLKGQTVSEILQDSQPGRPRWALNREYRSTYRRHLSDSEKVVTGQWVGRVLPGQTPVPISLEEEIADELAIGVGDDLEFDVQGMKVAARVSSLRQVEWGRVQPNFFAVFPAGILEQAPQFHVLVTRVADTKASADLQRAVVVDYPNVSAIDLALIVNTVDTILDRVAFVIRFMALFSIITGLTVLAVAVITSRYQRLRESTLLRTLGASQGQVLKIVAIEYFLLGTLGASSGLLLAIGAGWALARFVFEIGFQADWLMLGLSLVMVIGLTIAIGILNSRGVINRPPLEVLRSEI